VVAARKKHIAIAHSSRRKANKQYIQEALEIEHDSSEVGEVTSEAGSSDY
jgi:hypothetical protein